MTFRLNPELRFIPAFRLRNILMPPDPDKPDLTIEHLKKVIHIAGFKFQLIPEHWSNGVLE
jgi:hypothetical protein